jgi:RNA polymerase sigma factor (sigma-70 family)
MVLNRCPRERIVSLNDPLLRPLLEARDDAARGMALEGILIDTAAPTIRRALARFTRAEGGVQPADAEDIASTVTLRLVRKLQACAELEEEAIERLPDYIATQTFNAIHDHLRTRFPQRMRLKNRVRYVLTHDPRLALWTSSVGSAAGLACFRDTTPDASEIAITHSTATRAMLEHERPAHALFAILTRVGVAVTLGALVSKAAELWKVTDVVPTSAASLTIGDERPGPYERVEARQTLAIVWSALRELRAPQRAALLLNLRDVEGGNGVVVFLLANVASFEEIADAVGLSAKRLAEIWSDLPLDDLTIGEILGLKRQQVINLRQAARDRLWRRMSRGRRR